MPKPTVLLTLFLAAAFTAIGPSSAPGAPAGEGAKEDARWAWKPLARPAVPPVANPQWAKNPIDAFVFSRLQSAQLTPAPTADRRALARRAYFDLIGLPPSPEAVEAFAADPSPDAFEKWVDGLLGSRHFGERWARHWMDLVRYAEGHGHEFDFPIAYAWQYRDYLIRAFNADVPYDQFVREQIAGDLLPHPRLDPTEGFNESIIGTGFWWFGEQIHSPVDVRQHQADRIDNQVDVMAKTFLGLTVACARCHDHKFDPISQKDYTALFGIVESSRRQEAYLDPHGTITRAAKSMGALRHQGDEQLRASLPKPDAAWVEGVRGKLIAARLSARTGAVADSTDAARWREALADESIRPTSHPLYAWVTSPADDAGFAKWRQETTGRLISDAERAALSRKGSELLKSFSQGGYGDWKATGWAFADAPTRAGKWSPGKKGEPVHLCAAADSGRVSPRLRGVLSSPSFILTKPQLLYRVAGQGCKIRLIVDGYRMDQFSALLFAGAMFDVKTGGKFIWHRQAQDVSRYVGHRAHIEVIDDGDGWVAVDEIRLADEGAAIPLDPPSEWCRSILNDPDVTSIDTLASAYARRIGSAVERFAAGEADAQDATLVSWLIEHRLIEPGADATEKLRETKKQIDAIAARVPEPMRVLATADGNGIDERVFVRGNHNTLGATAQRAFLSSIAGPNQPSMGTSSGRLELAERMLDRSDPFVPRVMVNRVWHHLMGRGIVASVDNFGAMGERPSHPELLDYLADQFVNDGWSVKRLIRSIVLSRTYQMASRSGDAAAEQADPDNVLLHRANVRRLEAEPIRDSILAASGRLDPTLYGPSIDVYLTPFMEGRGKPKSGPLDGDGRRSIYLSVRRNFLSPMMLAFDAPTPFNTVGRRSVSNVPAQALMLMNDPFVIQQARRWATRVLEQKDLSPRKRVARMYQTAFSRPATEREIERGLKFLESQAAERGLDPASDDARLDLWADLAHALMNAKEFIFLN